MSPRLPYLPVRHYLERNGRALVTIGAALVGWCLLTHGLAVALRAPWIWYLSLGTLMMGLAGFRLVGTVLRDGLYLLTRDDNAKD